MEEKEESLSFADCQPKPVVRPLSCSTRLWLEGNKAIVFVLFALALISTVLSIVKQATDNELPSADDVGPTLSTGATVSMEAMVQTIVSLTILLLGALAAGYLAELARMPALLGMLMLGILLRNIPYVGDSLGFHATMGTLLRKFPFLIILLRAGLGLDAKALMKLKGTCVALAFAPCTVEAFVVALGSMLLLHISFLHGLLLGFVLAAVSPAVIVPLMLELQERGLGTRQGIPTLINASASIDDVYAITWFSVLLSIVTTGGSDGASLAWAIGRAPLEVIGGCVFGGAAGLVLWLFPDPQLSDLHVRRVALLIAVFSAALFGSEYVGVSTVGPIAVLVGSFVAAQRWQSESDGMPLPEARALQVTWIYLAQPFLFVLIGFQLDLSQLDLSSVIQSLIVLAFGLVFRIIVACVATMGTKLRTRERIFVAIAWLPKATVQAALAPVLLDLTRSKPEEFGHLQYEASTILTVGVMAILVTAPVGAILIRALSSTCLQSTLKANDIATIERNQQRS